jgi:hypothetical protein
MSDIFDRKVIGELARAFYFYSVFKNKEFY